MKYPPTYYPYEISYEGIVLETIRATFKSNVKDYIRSEYIHDGFNPQPKGKRYFLGKFKIVKK